MSIKTETADEKSRQWKRDLDARCSQWLESHPEGAETLNTSDMLTRSQPCLTGIVYTDEGYRYENGTKPFMDSASKLLPGGHLEKVIVSEILDGVWGVKVGDVLVDAYRGPDARQKALEKGEALAEAQKRRI